MLFKLKSKILAFIPLCLVSNLLSAQKLDSLYLTLIEAKEDTNKVTLLNGLAKELEYSDQKKSIDFTKEAIFLSQHLRYQRGLLIAYINKANYHFNRSDYNTGMEDYTSALLLSKQMGDKNVEALALNGIGLCYKHKSEYKIAIENFFLALALHEHLNNIKEQARVNANIGEVYSQQMQYINALKYFFRCLFIERKINDRRGIADAYSKIAFVYHKKNDDSKAKIYYQLSIEEFKFLHDKASKAAVLENIGLIEENQGNYLKALNYWLDALELRENLGDRYGIAQLCIHISNIYKINFDYKKSLNYAERAAEIGREIDAKLILKDSYYLVAEIYEKDKDHFTALLNFHKALELQNLLFNEATTKQIFEMEAKYESQKKEKEIDVLTKENRIQELELNKNRITIYSTILVILLLGFLVTNTYRRYQLKQKANRLITDQKAIVEQKQKEIIDSISYAKRLQTAILPAESFWKEHLPESFVLYRSKDIVAGDFYWMEKFPPSSLYGEGLILFAAADCTGHGVPGAMVSVVCCNALNRTLLEFGISEPGKLLDKARELVIATFEKSDENVKDGMDISLCSLDKRTNELLWAGANNPLWILSKNSNDKVQLTELIPDKQPVGNYEHKKNFKTHKIQLQKGDLIYLFTDGFADQFGGPKGKKFKYSALKEIIFSNYSLSLEEQKEYLETTFDIWKGNLEQVDDVCIIAVRV